MTAGSLLVSDGDLAWLLQLLDAARQRSIEGRAEFASGVVVDHEAMTAFSALGGEAVRSPGNGPCAAAGGATFRGGRGRSETVATIVEGGLAVVVMVERSDVHVLGTADSKPWVLRTTQVFRRRGRGWVRLHRHADPLVRLHSLEETMALGAGSA